MARSAPADRPVRASRKAPVGLAMVVKLIALATINATSIWALGRLIPESAWLAVAFVVITTLVIDVVYLTRLRWSIPLKYLLPGTFTLVLFQVYPVVYTALISTTNMGTGNLLDKDAAIEQIVETSRGTTESDISYTAVSVKGPDDSLGLVLERADTGELFLATSDGLEPLADDQVIRDGDRVVGAGDYSALTLREASDLQDELLAIEVPHEEGVIKLTTFNRAVLFQFNLVYDAAADTFTKVDTGQTFTPVDGNFVSADGTRLQPGWQANIGFDNYRRVLTSQAIRGPFVRVLIWNWVFAAGTVALSFAVGLLLATVLDHEALRGKRIYRSLLIFPYALPSFLTVLVWQGMLNRRFGVVNSLFHIDVPWLTDAWVAKASILMVSTWLSFPYFFLVATGALQSIPDELTEAAKVDGATGPQAFRKVTFPLLLVATAPLLIASFAFNFNNFNVIYFLNRGGPPIVGAQTPAGHTDILVSYTYRLALESGRGQDIGFATAISILIFMHVAIFSAYSFRKTARLEEI